MTRYVFNFFLKSEQNVLEILNVVVGATNQVHQRECRMTISRMTFSILTFGRLTISKAE
jgi:hypothetical protein